MNLADLSWDAVDALSRDIPVVIPVAALEQHGRHLPLFTDSMLLGEVMRRVSAKHVEDVLFAPLLWLGNSHHHLDFAGSLSASPRVYLDMLVGLMDNFLSHGFRRIVFMNGHGGNSTPGKQAVFEVRQKYRERTDLLLLFGTYWDFADPCVAGGPDLQQSSMGHACEWETSMVQCVAPHLVKQAATAEDVPVGFGFEPAYRGWTSKDRTEPGQMGSPRHANPEKGEFLFHCFAEGVSAFLEKVKAWDGRSFHL